MDLHKYYRENKDEINSSIMEIASDLAVGRLMNAHGKPFEEFVEADDPKDPQSCTHYKEEFQDEYNRLYDEEYERLAAMMHFDIGSEDGIRREDGPEDFPMQLARLVNGARSWQRKARSLIAETLREHGGRVTFTPSSEGEDYPVTASLYGRYDVPRINITDVYLEEGLGTHIMADGIDSESGGKETGFQIHDEQLYDIALFLKWVL